MDKQDRPKTFMEQWLDRMANTGAKISYIHDSLLVDVQQDWFNADGETLRGTIDQIMSLMVDPVFLELNMSRHAWLVKKLQPSSGQLGVWAFMLAYEGGLDLEGAFCFAGYVLEVRRQTGRHSVHGLWDGAVKSKRRFSRGKNRDNYIKAGKLVVPYLKQALGLHDDVPDVLVENDFLPDHWQPGKLQINEDWLDNKAIDREAFWDKFAELETCKSLAYPPSDTGELTCPDKS